MKADFMLYDIICYLLICYRVVGSALFPIRRVATPQLMNAILLTEIYHTQFYKSQLEAVSKNKLQFI